MPPATNTTKVWGKRLRDADGTLSSTPFSELSPEEKLQRRREERAEKKERDRTLSYFKNANQMLQQAAGTDAGMLASAVDGFFQELVKLLKADPSFHLLRNGLICQTIEVALQNALLLHSKTLLYMFLGHLVDLFQSPVASYVVETLLASLAQGLSGLASEDGNGNEMRLQGNFEAEMQPGGQGMHVGSGLPSTATLLSHVVEEISESLETFFSNEVGARAMRSLILMLGGYSIRNAPPPHSLVKFHSILGPFADSIIRTMEEVYHRDFQTKNLAETWITAAQTPGTSFILQSLLRVSEEGTQVDTACRAHLEKLHYQQQPLLQELLVDNMGCHIFESFLKVPTPAQVCEDGDNAMQSLFAASVSSSPLGKLSEIEKIALGSTATNDSEKHIDAELKEKMLRNCAWGRALKMVNGVWSSGAASSQVFGGIGGDDSVQRARFILQDLAVFAPSSLHLLLLWEQIFLPRLSLFWKYPALTGALVAFLRKAALDGSSSAMPITAPSEGISGSRHRSEEEEENLAILKDKAQGVRFFSVPVGFQKQVCDTICRSIKEDGMTLIRHQNKSCKCEAEFLLIHHASNEEEPVSAGEAVSDSSPAKGSSFMTTTSHPNRQSNTGPDIARYLLRFQPFASTMLQHSMEKLRVEDIQRVAHHRRGSLVLQQYLYASALVSPPPTTQPPQAGHIPVGPSHQNRHPQRDSKPSASAPLNAEAEKTPVGRFFRRISSFLPQWSKDKYAAYVVEQLYQVSSLLIKESMVQSLIPLFEEVSARRKMAAPRRQNPNEEIEEEKEERISFVIAKKVLQKCFVEQYMYRQDEWRKTAQRQCQVQHLTGKMILN